MRAFLAAVFALAVCGSVARAKTAADVEPLGMDEFTRVAAASEVTLEPAVRAAVAELVAALPEERLKRMEAGAVERLQDVEATVTLKDFAAVVDPEGSPALFAQLDDHADPVVRFLANALLAGGGDSDAADAVYAVLHSEEPTLEQKRMLATWAGGIGLSPAKDTAETIFTHLTTVMSKEPKIKVGEAAPDFDVKDAKGEALKLAELRGRVVLLHFWATSCGPCMGEMPLLKEQLAAYPEADLVVISVSLDEDRAKFAKAVEEHSMPWHNVFDGAGWGGAMARAYGVNRMPFDVVIDSQGVVQSNLREDLSKVIAAGK